MIKAVLFDMDGLLVDTENLNLKVAIKICKDLGLNLTPMEKQSCIGVTSQKFYTDLFQNRKLIFDLKKTLGKHFKIYDKLLKIKLKHFPGAKTLPLFLKSQGYKLALVSGSTKKQVNIVLSQLGIKNLFDIIITADDLHSSKPDPEGFLLSAKRLKISPEECIVLEDSTPGIMAAKKAGMKVIGVINNGQQDLALADFKVKDLTKIKIKMFSSL